MESKDEQIFMKERPVLSLVLSMSIPMVLSMTVNSLYNIVDSYFVAKISEDAMTAISLVFPLQNLVNAVAIGYAPVRLSHFSWEPAMKKRQMRQRPSATLYPFCTECFLRCSA